MKKVDLVEIVAKELNESKSTVTAIIDKTFEVIGDTMANNDAVDIYGFAKFEPVLQNARQSRNPKTGEIKETPSKLVPKCRFRTAVKNKLIEA